MEEDKVTLAEQQEKRMKNTSLVNPNIEARGRRARKNIEKGPEKEKRIRVKWKLEEEVVNNTNVIKRVKKSPMGYNNLEGIVEGCK